MSLQDQLLDIERTLWTSDPLIYRQSLIEEAVLVFGDTGPIGRDAAIDAIHKEVAADHVWEDVKIENVISMTLDTNAALLTYKATARWKHQTVSLTVLATSVYVRRGDDWKLALHQQTPYG